MEGVPADGVLGFRVTAKMEEKHSACSLTILASNVQWCSSSGISGFEWRTEIYEELDDLSFTFTSCEMQ